MSKTHINCTSCQLLRHAFLVTTIDRMLTTLPGSPFFVGQFKPLDHQKFLPPAHYVKSKSLTSNNLSQFCPPADIEQVYFLFFMNTASSFLQIHHSSTSRSANLLFVLQPFLECLQCPRYSVRCQRKTTHKTQTLPSAYSLVIKRSK